MLPLQTSLSAGRTRKPQKGEHGGGLLGVSSTQRGQSICTAYPGGGGSTEALGKVLCSVPTAHRCHPWDAPQMPQKKGEAHVLGQAESPPGWKTACPRGVAAAPSYPLRRARGLAAKWAASHQLQAWPSDTEVSQRRSPASRRPRQLPPGFPAVCLPCRLHSANDLK